MNTSSPKGLIQLLPSARPRILWIELTSTCPFDCIFCSRKGRRGVGEHMPFELFRKILEQLDEPEIIRLNYSGESLGYPKLRDALLLAKQTGAIVELVTALASGTKSQIEALVDSGLDRLTVSIHALNPRRYHEIYRHSSVAELRRKLDFLLEYRDQRRARSLEIDFSFVAMRNNLEEIIGIAQLAARIGAASIVIHPVIRRDLVSINLDAELSDTGDLQPGFLRELKKTVELATRAVPDVSISVARGLEAASSCDRGPGIATCEQNPWETIHVLSNGDVVVCEVQDRVSMGSLQHQSLLDIWRGASYTSFRKRFLSNREPTCSICPWYQFRPQTLWKSEVEASDDRNPQFVRGWHQLNYGESARWSAASSALLLDVGNGVRQVNLEGTLPPAFDGAPVTLSIFSGGYKLGTVQNTAPETAPFHFSAYLPVLSDAMAAGVLTFHSSPPFSPKRAAVSTDGRELGFALSCISGSSTKASGQPRGLKCRMKELAAWPLAISCAASGVAARLKLSPKRMDRQEVRQHPNTPGISIAIPECGTPELLERCLDSIEPAVAGLTEPIRTIVLVNGAPPQIYRHLIDRFKDVWFHFAKDRLGFSKAVCRLLNHVDSSWVYLLNSDAVLENGALVEVAQHRGPSVFALASQITCRDEDGRRIETNWTVLSADDGLVRIWDAWPPPDTPVTIPYAGATGALFQAPVLRRLASQTIAYDPFYWEDVEWGAAAARQGLHCLLIPSSRLHHVRRATVRKYFSPSETDRIFERNRLLFQLRGYGIQGTLQAAVREMGRSSTATLFELYARWDKIVQGRYLSSRLKE